MPTLVKADCIYKYQKRIGDESFSFCGEPMGDRCVEGDICRYCTAYEKEEEEDAIDNKKS